MDFCSGRENHYYLGIDDAHKNGEQYPGNCGEPYPKPSYNGNRPGFHHGLGQLQENKQTDEDSGADAYARDAVEAVKKAKSLISGWKSGNSSSCGPVEAV